ncbi:hypothetical protein BaRGS_00004027 [Batillaria attramentaria]|uniref:LRRCT domain-containing protein n=1 Tax=Batillaria attramentaria TaxID=370345 RepID=A0ABD0LZF3_9CAEN
MESWLPPFVAFLLVICTRAADQDVCTDNCMCKPEGRGLLVTCEGGNLATIMDSVPHNTARLMIQKLTTTHVLNKTHFGQRDLPITKLSITHSALQDVESAAFAALISLQELDLSENDIKTIAADAFSGLSGLHFLKLSSNRLAELGTMLTPLVSLQELDVSDNHIADLPPSALQSQSSITSLRLDGNQLRSLKGSAFTSLTLLTHLKVRNCNLFYVNEDLFEAIPRITVLDLGGNRLSRFPNSVAFSRLQQLRELYLDNNELLKLHPSQFADLNLRSLSLSGNRLIELPDDALKGLLVEDLDLSENKLQHISGDALKPLASLLTRLTIAYNPIRHLNANIFSSLHQLEFLNISSCSLSTLPAKMFSNLYSLHRLDISWNRLQNISEDLIDVFDRISKVNLQQNDLLCDCHIRPLRDWLRSTKSGHKLYCIPGSYGQYCGSLRCTSPENLAGRRVALLDNSELEDCGAGSVQAKLPAATQVGIVMACLVVALSVLVITLYLWRRGRTRKGLKRIIFKPRRKRDSHDDEDEENEKIDPLADVDNDSLKESHRSFVFRHYFDQMVTDPKLLSRPSVSQPPSESQLQTQRDSMYSSNPSLYETSHNSHSIVVGIESAV